MIDEGEPASCDSGLAALLAHNIAIFLPKESLLSEKCERIIGPDASLLNSFGSAALALAESDFKDAYVHVAFRLPKVYDSSQ